MTGAGGAVGGRTVGGIEVLAPGPMTTIQDGGRSGWAHLGVPSAGPADWLAHGLANRLVGNPPGTAALECTIRGPRLRFETAATVAAVGAPLLLDGVTAAPGRGHRIGPGATVEVGAAARVRGYLAVGGGIGTEAVLGSRATDTLSGLGPPRLAAGDLLPAGTGRAEPGRLRGHFSYDGVLRVLPGPRDEWFRGAVTDGIYTVGPDSDRTGVRLHGPALRRVRTDEVPTEGMVTGAIQVPPEGRPIVLLPNHGVTGGYPVAAVVISADHHKLGQLPPGSTVIFRSVDLDTARRAYRDLLARVESAVTAGPAGSGTRGA